MCPTDYPDEVFYNVWPGLAGYCDCFDRDFREEKEFFIG
jgi:hypothetical protein